MSKPCDQLNRFLDGELSEAEAKAFRTHLPSCPDCSKRLSSAMQLIALEAETARAAQGPETPRAVSSVRAFRPRWMRRTLSGVSLAIAGALAILFTPMPESTWFPYAPERRQEAWLTSSGPRHWPQKGTPQASHAGSEPLNPGALLLLTLRGDNLGIAEAYLAREDSDAAEAYLARASPSAGVEVARALVARSREQHGIALQWLDSVLAKEPQHPQARWARALVLGDLGLSLAAADEFQTIADLKQPGWSAEAQARVERLRADGQADAMLWLPAWERAQKLVATGAPAPTSEDVHQFPGMWRAVLYDAIRAADSPETVAALEPAAAELDRLGAGPDGGQVLTEYVRWVERRDFRRRSPLAQRYRDVFAQKLPPAGVKALLGDAERAGEPDLVLGVLHRGKLIKDDPKRFTDLVDASRDPSLTLMKVYELAGLDLEEGKVGIERELLKAAGECGRSRLPFRCAQLQLRLVELYSQLHLPEEALKHARSGWELSRQIHEWGLELQFLQHLGQITRLRRQLPLMRAYLVEAKAQISGKQSIPCNQKNQVHELLASEALLRLRADEATQELSLDPECNQPSVFRGMLLVESARQRHDSSTLPKARKELEQLVESGLPNEGERLLAREYVAEAELQVGAPSTVADLQDIIRAASALSGNPFASKARAAAFTSLVREAGRRGAHGEVLRLVAGERGLPEPTRCTLAVDADDEMVVFAGKDTAGQLFGRMREDLPEPLGSVRGLIPGELSDRFRQCPAVEVLARPSAFGRAGLLPPELPWSYRLRSAPATRSGGHRRLVITGAQPPPYLELPQLNDWQAELSAGADILLRGADATPNRVLEAMQGADEIVINAHGLAENDVSDASIIALSPDPASEGRYWLRADDVRARVLSSAPIVVLGACFAAKTAPYPHVPLSLPAAFIEVGSSAVLASASEVPDVDQSLFFDAVLRRIRAGQLPAVAVRDERMAWASRPRGAWTNDVLVFE
jgi:hypothetical protein